MKAIRIRDAHATINGDTTETAYDTGSIEIIADDGRCLYGIRLVDGCKIEVSTGSICKSDGALLDDRLIIQPNSSNRITISRPEYA